MLTCDKKNRYRELERKIVLQYRVRQFVFSGNQGGLELAKLLASAYPRMRQFARGHEPPFIAVVTKIGNIYQRMDKTGKMSAG
jgi:hypothetical protein